LVGINQNAEVLDVGVVLSDLVIKGRVGLAHLHHVLVHHQRLHFDVVLIVQLNVLQGEGLVQLLLILELLVLFISAFIVRIGYGPDAFIEIRGIVPVVIEHQLLFAPTILAALVAVLYSFNLLLLLLNHVSTLNASEVDGN
jgi:hypothetical protein